MCVCCVFCLQAEDGIRELVRFLGLGDVYKRQAMDVDVEVAGLGAFRVPVDPSIGCVASKPFIPRVQYSQFVESFGQVRHLGDGFDGPISVRSCGHPGSIQEALPDRAQFWPTAGHQDDCLLYTSDAADERSSVDLGGRRIIKKKQQKQRHNMQPTTT